MRNRRIGYGEEKSVGTQAGRLGHGKIPFEDMQDVHDENGEWMDFDGVRGRSVLRLPK